MTQFALRERVGELSAEEAFVVDSLLPSSHPPGGRPLAVERGSGGASPTETVFPGLSPVEQALITVLVKKGLLSPDQVRVAQVYSKEHNRDLRQAILELNLISPELLNQLAFERLSALADNGDPRGTGTGLATAAMPLSPDRTQHHRDVRKDLQEKAATVSLSELVSQILESACDCQATDIHFDPQESGLRVRYRIDGQLQDILFVEPAMAVPVISRLKVVSNLNIVERKHSQDGRITIHHHNKPRDLRLATFPTIFGEKIVIRIHEVLTDVTGFSHLGMTDTQAETLDKLITQPYGAILVAGPVGAGKTSTLYNCLERINSPLKNVMTIEDPIEHRIPGVNQCQINNAGDMGFSEGLRAMLRQDPDVVMIGEIRDDETAKIGIRAALTGVLVFSTLHGSDAPSTISNLYKLPTVSPRLSSSPATSLSHRFTTPDPQDLPILSGHVHGRRKSADGARARLRRAPRAAASSRTGLPGDGFSDQPGMLGTDEESTKSWSSAKSYAT